MTARQHCGNIPSDVLLHESTCQVQPKPQIHIKCKINWRKLPAVEKMVGKRENVQEDCGMSGYHGARVMYIFTTLPSPNQSSAVAEMSAECCSCHFLLLNNIISLSVLIVVLLLVSLITVMFYVDYLISLTHLCFIVFFVTVYRVTF